MLDSLLARWPLKLLALGLSFAIWLVVTGENRVIRAFQIPVDVELGEVLTLAGTPPSAAEVQVRGPASVMRTIDPLELAFRIDLSQGVPGARRILLTADRLDGLPRGVEVARVQPDAVDLELENRMRRTLPVEPSLEGEPAEGYALYGVQVLPDSLEVEGPESRVSVAERLRTEPIGLDQRSEPFLARVAAIPGGPAVRIIDPRRIEVRIDIDAAPETATFEGVPVVPAGTTLEAAIKPESVAVTLSAPPELLRKIGPEQIRAVADLTGLEVRRRPHQVELRIEFADLPARELSRLSVRSVGRKSVSVRLTEPEPREDADE